jgi:hypothetical protein
MNATYAAGQRGARAAAREGAAVVVVDTFRASTTISVLISKGARVVPVASIEEAASYTEVDYRIGERDSAKVQGFDFGNSPTEIEAAELRPGATVVLSTTNGTRIIEAARGAPAILAGAFVNAQAVAEALVNGNYGALRGDRLRLGGPPGLRGRVGLRCDPLPSAGERRKARRAGGACRGSIPYAPREDPPPEQRRPAPEAPRL